MGVTIIVLTAAVAVVAGVPVITWLLLRRWPAGSRVPLFSRKQDAAISYADTVLNHLRRLNCYPETVEGAELPVFKFEFQGGNFIAKVKTDDDDPFRGTLSVSYYNCMEIPVEYLTAAAVLCNSANDYSLPVKATYAADSDAGVLRVSLHSSGLLVDDSEASCGLLRTVLLCCFHLQRDLHDSFEKMKAENPPDIVRDRMLSESVFNALHAAEMLRNPYLNMTAGPALTVGEFASVALGLAAGGRAEFVDMRIEGTRVEYSSSNIAQYGFLGPLASGSPRTDVAFTVRTPGGDEHMVMIAARLESAVDGRLKFARVDAMASGLPLSPLCSESNPGLEPKAVSVVIGLDATSAQLRRAEAEYMAAEDPRLKRVKEPELAYALYWGATLFAGKRYYEAVTYLANAYAFMSGKFAEWGHSDEAESRELFQETMFMLGMCFMELKRYERAYYFFDQLMPMKRVVWAEAYVRCLVALNDSRTFDVIDSIQEFVRKQIEQQGGTPDPSLAGHLEFLTREQITLLVRQEAYDAARVILDRILAEDPGNLFAVDMLAEIERRSAAPKSGHRRYTDTGNDSKPD